MSDPDGTRQLGGPTILKLGGSVVTQKDRPETLDGAALDRASELVAAGSVDELVLVHGGGSFGHHNASEHGVSTTDGTHDAGAVVDIHGAMTTLNRFLLERLHENDVPALPVHPLSGAFRSEEALTVQAGTVERMIGEGFVPVLHGDVIVDEGNGATVLSGDEIVTELATELHADRVGLCSTVPGVLDEDGTVISHVDRFETVADVLGESDATDVSGGMAAKVRELLDLDTPASIFDLDGLAAFLGGGQPGTTIG